MVDQPSDSGYELVLDNRRLIIAFAVLILFCGCFFVVGFIEGKRQGFQAGSQAASESMIKPGPDETQAPATQAAGTDAGAKPAGEKPDEHPLEWYKNVNGRGEKPEIETPSARSNPAAAKTTAKPSASAVIQPRASAPATVPSSYSVQVGAFRQRAQIETKAQQLRSKGFDCRIESPESPDGLYLLKVGRFKSRAEAVAMQLRLKKSGFSSFIKTN
jgi:cell division protein FtsN